MRRVRIVDEPDNTYAYAAIDRQTGEIPLRHHDRTELIALCRRLDGRSRRRSRIRSREGRLAADERGRPSGL